MKIRSVGKISSGRKSLKAKTIKMVLPALTKGRYKTEVVYKFDELSPEAKEKAREWMRNAEAETYDTFEMDFELRDWQLKEEFEKKNLKLKSVEEKSLIWDFDRGQYFGGKFVVEDEDGVEFTIDAKNADRGRIEVTREYSEDDKLTDAQVAESEQLVKERFEDVAHSVLKAIREDYEYRFTDESIDETIRINEYDFDENGGRA